MRNVSQGFRDIRPALIVSLVCFAIFGYLIWQYNDRSKEIWEKDERARLTRLLNNTRSNLESELYARIYYTRSVAAYVSLHPDLDDKEYFNLAGELVKADPVINSMSLAPDGIIRALYPKTGHEDALGLNLLDHPERRKIVEQTIKTQRTFVAGPVELVEGGIAFISYTPIFDRTQKDSPFWGITDIVIRRNQLFAAANFSEFDDGTRFAIRGYDGSGNDGAVFYGDPAIFDQSPVTTSVQLPDGEWVIGAIPQRGWSSYLNQDNILLGVLIVSGVIIAVLIGMFSGAMIRIRSNARQLSSIFNAMTSTILELDARGTVRWIAPTNSELITDQLPLEVGDGIPAFQIEEGLDVFEQALTAAVEHREVRRIEISVKSGSSTKSLIATLSPKGPDTATLVLYDVTKLREQRAQIEASREKLRELNQHKDMLFSVIAHDLRNPASAIVNLSELLLEAPEVIDPKEQTESIELIYQSGKQNLFLLENLLNWAESQQDGLSVRQEDVDLSKIVDQASNTFRELASLKKIELELDLTDAKVRFDPTMLETVLRNLISNALKFTNTGGKITVSTKRISESQVELYVKDDGVGMDQAKLEGLTEKIRQDSSAGTQNETGTGLGLPLCWEFLERNFSSMQIESELGKGTTVSCKLNASEEQSSS